ncbi:MAG: serine hydrolase [Gemmatimonadota bacterium]
MRNLCLLMLLAAPCGRTLAAQQLGGLETLLRARIAVDTAAVAVAYYDPVTRDTLLINGQLRYHAASTMKLPVLIELARRVDAGELTWAQTIPVRNSFRSLADGSQYSLDLGDDSDSTLYEQIGHDLAIERLARLMIVRSSNLATNVLLERLDPSRVNATAHALGADSIEVLRGVEDGKAYALGLNNTTTARDLALLLDAIARGRAASRAQTARMLEFLLGQEFNDGIPAGLPPGVRVAHKTGWITATSHDAAIIYPPGRGPYVLVILTRGYEEPQQASRLMADLSEMVYRWATRRPDPHE